MALKPGVGLMLSKTFWFSVPSLSISISSKLWVKCASLHQTLLSGLLKWLSPFWLSCSLLNPSSLASELARETKQTKHPENQFISKSFSLFTAWLLNTTCWKTVLKNFLAWTTRKHNLTFSILVNPVTSNLPPGILKEFLWHNSEFRQLWISYLMLDYILKAVSPEHTK